MALISPGLEVSIVDESQYLPTAAGTVPFLLFATSENKIINNTLAAGTKKVNAGKIYGISSQRELASLFGTPKFRTNAAGTPIHGDETNEYGLMAAYSALSLGNRVWAIRADIDLDQLLGTTVRPVGESVDGTNWFDYSTTNFGIFEYNQTLDTFVKKMPTVVTDGLNVTMVSGVLTPRSDFGAVGSYAVYVPELNNNVFYKTNDNIWVRLGSSGWANKVPVATSTTSAIDWTMGGPFGSGTFTLNDRPFTISADITSMNQLAELINAANIAGISASVNNAGRLELFATTAAENLECVVLDGTTSPLASIGLKSDTYRRAVVEYGAYTQVPEWNASEIAPRPSGSIWIKTTSQAGGANFVMKQYVSSTGSWKTLATPLYTDGFAALADLDSNSGGLAISPGSMFVKYNAANDGRVSFNFYTLPYGGITSVTGSVPAAAFVLEDTFTVVVSVPGTATPISRNCILSGTTASAFVQAILLANIPNVGAKLEASGAITITHNTGGIITLTNTTTNRNPIATAGFTTATTGVVPNIVPGSINLSNWTLTTYTYSATAPYASPEDGTLWYDSSALDVDVMICGTNGWKGYKNVTRDTRGFNLSNTDPMGVIISPTAPVTQTDNTALVPGDLWLDSGDLENYPSLYRRTATNTWTMIDNTDRLSTNGIVFADARWDASVAQVNSVATSVGGLVDAVSGAYPSIAAMQFSDYLDLDAPDYRLYPRGTLLFNTRRSGYIVKKYVSNYFNQVDFPESVLPTQKSTWVSQITFKSNGQPAMGHYSQRAKIVSALKAAVDSSTDIRGENYNFNLLACPGYPELVSNLVTLNTDRANTGFVIGDTPMNLEANINSFTEYASGVTGVNEYVGLYYPSALATDTTGKVIAVPASHMVLRTFLHSDSVSYQWFAPAGTRRGLVDNASAIGYIDYNSGAFINTGVSNQLRDSLYELKINPITFLQGVGITVYGQKTRAATSSSMDRINVARLVNYLRTALAGITNQYLFEPNDKVTRDQAKTTIESFLNDLIVKRGLYDYLVVCDTTNNTSDRVARNELYIDIAIEPMKDVEFIYIPIRLKNPGSIAASSLGAV